MGEDWEVYNLSLEVCIFLLIVKNMTRLRESLSLLTKKTFLPSLQIEQGGWQNPWAND